MFVKSVVLVALFLGVQGSTPLRDEVVQGLLKYARNSNAPRADASQYVDEVLANVRVELIKNGGGTIPIDDVTFGFSQEIFGVTWHGEATLAGGFVGGLETIHRTGVADLAVDPNGDIVITVDAGVNTGSLGADLSVKFMDLGPAATVVGTIKNIAVKLTLRVKLSTAMAQLDKLDIHNLGTLSIVVKGLGFILNFLIKIVVDVFGNLVKGVVGEFLQGPLKDIINTVIAKLLFPAKLVSTIATIEQQAMILPRYLTYVH